ncbi:MAG: hypothetical protein ACI4XI_01450 [Ruminococcus sp.]
MKDISTISLSSLKKQLKNAGYVFVDKISSGGCASTIIVKKGFWGGKRCAKVFVESTPDEVQAEFETMKRLFCAAPDKFPEPFDLFELTVNSAIYDDDTHKVYVLVMELLEPLHIPSDADADFWLRFLTELTESLVEMHHIDYNHKDIKPDNVMIKNGRFILIDYGISIITNDTLGPTNTFAGTEYFASPEALEGKNAKRSDIYSLGATARALILQRTDELITYDSRNNPVSTSFLIEQKRKLKPLQFLDESFKFICDIVNKSMSFNIADRFQSAVELLNTLKPINSFPTQKKSRGKTPVPEDTADFSDNINSRISKKEYVAAGYADKEQSEQASAYIPNKYNKAETERAEPTDLFSLSNHITKAKIHIEKGKYEKAMSELEGIEHPITDFLKAKILMENDDSSYMIYLKRSAEHKYPPAMLAYGYINEQYHYVIEAAEVYTQAFRVAAKLFQQGKIDKDTFISLNNKNRFGSIDRLDKAFIKQTSNKNPPYGNPL